MKNLKKMLAVVTAIATMLASGSAFAELDLSDKDAVIDTFTCTEEDTTSPSVTASVASNVVGDGEMTFLILNKNIDKNTTNIEADDILYIDQHSSEDGTSFTGVINVNGRVTGASSATALPEGTYPVIIGYYNKSGNFQRAIAVLEVKADSTGGTTVEVRWGDVTLDGSIDTSDSLAVLYFIVDDVRSYPTSATESFEAGQFTVGASVGDIRWGDVTLDGSIDTSDSLAVLYFIVDDVRTYDGNTVGDEVEIDLAE